MKKIQSIIIFVTLFLGFLSCAESDDFSSNPNLKLEFSSDTIRFDTVFTTIGSATHRFSIRNKNSNSIRISSIEIMNPTASGFRMNIDGESGSSLANLEVLKKDSLFGFLEVTVNPQHVNSAVLIRDSIRFVVNGNIQYVQLEAIGRDVHLWKNKSFSTDTTLTGSKPYLIYDTLAVEEGVVLKIEDKAELYFHDKASMQVYGTIQVNGTKQHKIVFRGDRLDMMTAAIPYDNVSGQWNGITFYENSFNNELENVVVKNAVDALSFLPSMPNILKAKLDGIVVHNSSKNGIVATNCHIEVINGQFTNSGEATLKLVGGKYSFLHSTIANYYRWTPRRSPAIVVSNKDKITGDVYALDGCDFMNSIVYGTMRDELLFNKEEGTTFEYKFTNCLIRNKEDADVTRFANVIWNKDPLFTYLNGDGDYNYNFRLSQNSPAINVADGVLTGSIMFDLDGKPRISGEAPDVGCYEWTP